MHDRQKGIIAWCLKLQIVSYSCAFHLEININHKFKSKFGGKIWKAATALKESKFELVQDQDLASMKICYML